MIVNILVGIVCLMLAFAGIDSLKEDFGIGK